MGYLSGLSVTGEFSFSLHEGRCHNTHQLPVISFSMQEIQILPVADKKLVRRGQKGTLPICLLENGGDEG